MKVFITGGAGFIGSHLADRLILDGHHVVVLDNLSTGSMDNIGQLVGHDRFELRVGSVHDYPLVAELVDRADLTVHLAAAVGVRLILEQPVHTIETNVHGTEVVLKASAVARKKVMVASTSEVYGKNPNVTFSETDDLVLGSTMHSRWAYACSKALDEWLALAYYHEKGVPVVITRFFNTVGPRQTGQYGMVVPNFARQALEGEPITVFGSGDQSRCFGHVKDAVEALIRLMKSPDAVGQVFNVGTEEEITIRGLAERIREAAGGKSEIITVPYEEAYSAGFEDMLQRKPDVRKLRACVDFAPSTSLETIIEDVVADQRARLKQG